MTSLPTDAPLTASLTIRTLQTARDMEAAVELQKIYWGEDMAALVPAHMLLSLRGHGGHLPAAFDGDRMVGLLIGFIGADLADDTDASPVAQRLLVMSKRMVVLPEYRSHNIGTLLKLAQRDFARRCGIELVTWTFDPLLARNAYLNLCKLGGVGQRYVLNYFGVAAEHARLTEDRIVVNWWVNHPHTVAHIAGQAPKLSLSDHLAAGARLLNPIDTPTGEWPQPTAAVLPPDGATVLVEIPAEALHLEQAQPALLRAWRDHVRAVMQPVLAAGYIATDFVREGRRTAYVFTRDDGSFVFSGH
jgi:predicted GNAT superfamily acetyltransferase